MANYSPIELRFIIDFNQCLIIQLTVQGGAILMTPEQTVKLIQLLKDKRTELSLSVNEVARRADVDPGTAWRIEQGMIAKPRVESLIAIGRVLGINAMELFTTVGWLISEDLPDLGTYLRAKYGVSLSDHAIDDIEHYVTRTRYVYTLADTHGHIPDSPADRRHASHPHLPPSDQPKGH
ncbi:helix-turn-helix domain-containing protein [Mycolicibacterium fortuitum]|uniref:helix-turn-helix domain-containing protein n=1 Tax=Mycolicibacterium fortuitum TaxID=1766 RepID=UPI00241ECDE7|nr:helix-turn-helix transcriptional regulator [Mycolicibacterium fortuitum]MDG5769988.1 helix-turn-helix transcriptional regulator [Mycolicibacterium fortuitum]MDG5780433.1 helix-turn-helix transcriptional regulator [Mycolicibacterium fortuitum]